MSETFQISATERGLVRLFTIDLTPDDLEDLREAQLAAALGVDAVDVDQIDVFTADDLKGLGLVGYMTTGLGIADAELTADRTRLEALKGPFVVVRSAAFKGQELVLAPQSPLRWIGTYPEENAPVQFEPLPDEAAKGTVAPTTKPRPSDAAMSGRVATVVLLVLFALTAVLVWIAA